MEMMHELVIDGTPTGTLKDFGGMAPPDFSEHPTKSGYVWLPKVRDDPVLAEGEIYNGETKAIEAGEVVYRRNARAKTAPEVRAEDFAELREATGDAIVLLVRLIQRLMAAAPTVLKPADFTTVVRQAYIDAKVIADKLDPGGA